MTLDDMYDNQGLSGEQIMANNLERERVEQAIISGDFTRQERKYLSALLGVGQFKNKPPMNKNAAAISAGITYSQGGTALNKLRKMLDGR